MLCDAIAETVNLMKIIRTYSELIKLPTFIERYNYLKLDGRVGTETFGFERIFNQMFYKSPEWLEVRDFVIIRDGACDLGMPGHDIHEGVKIYIHHMNPINLDDIVNKTEYLLNPDFLITTIFNTHQAIHYGNKEQLIIEPTVRTRYDTCPWKKS